MKFRNVSPLGDLSIAGVGEVAAGAEFDGPDDLAEQTENFEQVNPPATAAPKDGTKS